MRLPDILGVIGALVVGGLLTVLLLASAVSAPPALPSSVPLTIPPLPTPTPAAQHTNRPTLIPGASATPGHIVPIGQPAPRLQVTLTDGSLLDSADYAGQPLWINFMATWTPQSITELPLMKRYQKDLDGQLLVIVVDVGESRDTVRPFIRQLDVNMPVGVDEDTGVQATWGAYALPVHVFIDAAGIVRQVVYGGASPAVWDQAIALIVPDFVPPEESLIPQ